MKSYIINETFEQCAPGMGTVIYAKTLSHAKRVCSRRKSVESSTLLVENDKGVLLSSKKGSGTWEDIN